jgi:hypothetical protein
MANGVEYRCLAKQASKMFFSLCGAKGTAFAQATGIGSHRFYYVFLLDG